MQSINPAPVQANALPANSLALKDIHVPDQISDYPIAYGWWMLAGLLLIAIVIAVIKFKKSAKRNQVKKQALTQLKNNLELNNSELISLLKWAAMFYFPRGEIAKLYGDSLQAFLIQQLPQKHQENFTRLSEQAFKNQYQQSCQNEIDKGFHQAVRLWLMQALPPNRIKQAHNISEGVKI